MSRALSPVLRILLVDDDEDVATLTQQLLDASLLTSYSLHWVNGCDDASAALAANEYDVCLLDDRLGPDDGLEVLARAREVVPDLPIVVLTGLEVPDMEARALELGAADYLRKHDLTAASLDKCIRYAIERGCILTALRAQTRELRAMFDGAADAMLVADDQGRLVDVNPAALSLMGLRREQLLRLSLHDLVAGQHQERLRGTHSKFSIGGVQEGELELERPDGQLRYTEVRATARIVPGRHLLIVRDVTERRRAEQGRAINEARYRTLFEHAPEALTMVDLRTGELVAANPSFKRLFGPDMTSILPLLHAVRTPLMAGRASLAVDDGALAQLARVQRGEIVSLDCAFWDAGGEQLPCRVTLVGMPSTPEEQLGRASIVDLREQRRLETLRAMSESLRHENERMREDVGLRRRFFAFVSHELKAPLNVLIGYAELLYEQALPPAQQRSALQSLVTGGRHLVQLINDVLDVAKLDAGTLRFTPQRIALAQVVEEVCSLFAPALEEKQLELEIAADPALEVVSDPLRLRQVLYNYLSNAVKYTRENSKVRIAAMAEPGGSFRVSVSDQGDGVSPDDAARLFTDFEQLGTHQVGSSGLGLAITKHIVEAQGGSVGVTSEARDGTTFWAVLPGHAELTAESVVFD